MLFTRPPRTPHQHARATLFYGVFMVALLIMLATTYHLVTIPKQLRATVDRQLLSHTWLQNLVVVDGRRLYLRGTIDANFPLAPELAALTHLPGVARVINRLQPIDPPPCYVQIEQSAHQLRLTGLMNGATHAHVTAALAAQLDLPLTDHSRIDDRVGRPLWLEHFATPLSLLQPLATFGWHGGPRQVELSGIVAEAAHRQQLGAAIAAALPHTIIINRLTAPVPDHAPTLTLFSNWHTTQVTGRVPTHALRQRWQAAVAAAFTATEPAAFTVTVAPDQTASAALGQLPALLADLTAVHDLRLTSTATGFALWGRVDTAAQRVAIQHARARLGLTDAVISHITVAASARDAHLSLFFDGELAVVHGLLPNRAQKQRVLAAIRKQLTAHIIDHLRVAPHVTHRAWLHQWSPLLAALPTRIIGISLDARAILLTAILPAPAREQLYQQVATLFPTHKRLNWTRAK